MTDLTASDAAGLPARRAALDLLAAALNRRSGFDEAAATPAFRNLEPRDRGFARALVLATLRHLGPIDRALDGRISREPPEVVRNILRLGAAQAFVLGTPAFAAVGTSVDLVAELKEGRAFKGVVNAILRGLTREPPDMTDPELLAPPWLFSRWSAAFGEDAARAMATLIAAEPATDLSLKAPSPDLAAALEAEPLPGGTLRSALRGEISTWPGFAEGAWWVQDASAAVPARLLSVKPGESALDLCAAPGGKTLQLAAAGASVVAVDRSAPRLVRVAENLARMGLTAETATDDAGSWPDPRTFDAVLLDAPCSATGTYRRNRLCRLGFRPRRVAESVMSWLTRTLLGLALAFSASAALAGCPGPCDRGRGYDDGYRGGQSSYSGGYSLRTYGDVAQHYGSPSCGGCAAFAHERAYEERRHDDRYADRYDDRGPPCRQQRCGGDCRQCGELILSNAFSYDGGVGPYPEGGYGGGGGGYVAGGGFAGAGAGSSAGASASARASASASSSSHVSINIGRGGGGHKGGGGCKTCGGGGHKGGYGGHK